MLIKLMKLCLVSQTVAVDFDQVEPCMCFVSHVAKQDAGLSQFAGKYCVKTSCSHMSATLTLR